MMDVVTLVALVGVIVLTTEGQYMGPGPARPTTGNYQFRMDNLFFVTIVI